MSVYLLMNVKYKRNSLNCIRHTQQSLDKLSLAIQFCLVVRHI